MRYGRWNAIILFVVLSLTLISGTLVSAAPPRSANGQGTPPLPDIEWFAQRVHMHNRQDGNVTVWAGGTLGTELDLAPTFPLGTPLIEWEFPALEDGQPSLVLDELERATLINLWASWCDPCIHELPLLAQIALTPDDHTYDVVFLDVWEDPEEGQPFMANQPEGLRVGSDPNGGLLSIVGAPGIPTSILLDAEQNVLAIHVGNYTAAQAALFEQIAADPTGYDQEFDPTALDVPAQFVIHETVDMDAVIDLEVGDTVAGRISAESGQTAYRVTGRESDVITVRMEADASQPNTVTLEPYIILLAADGTFLVESTGYLSGPSAQLRDFTLPADGEYIIIATRFMNMYGYSTGTYTLTVTEGVMSAAPLVYAESTQ